jgi:hypothetical protein
MTLWARAAVLGVVAAVMGGAACGATGSVTSSELQCGVYLGGGVIPAAPDGASLCPAGPCNFQTQEGCGTGANCVPHYDAAQDAVVPACLTAGARARGETCDNITTICARGLLCVEGQCAKDCCGGDWTACPAGESCIRQAVALRNGKGVLISYDEGLGYCARVNNCDVLDATSCAGNTARPVCRIADPLANVACMPPSDKKVGDPCDRASQCGPVMTCAATVPTATTPTSFTCRHLCRWGTCHGKPACGPDEGTCVHFNRDPLGVGECTPNWQGPAVSVDGGFLAQFDGSGIGRPKGGAGADH